MVKKRKTSKLTVKKRLPSTKSIQNKAINIWKQICFKRDGNMCQVKRFYPLLDIVHSPILQIDHCISRSNKNLFFEPKNGTVICATCNMLKSMQSKSVHRIIDTIVIHREGQQAFDAMVALDKTKSPNVNFGKRWWLEDKIDELQGRLDRDCSFIPNEVEKTSQLTADVS